MPGEKKTTTTTTIIIITFRGMASKWQGIIKLNTQTFYETKDEENTTEKQKQKQKLEWIFLFNNQLFYKMENF